VAAWQAGAAVAGCSAGAGALTTLAPDVRGSGATMGAGLALVPHVAVIPHFDRMAAWNASFATHFRDALPADVTLVGIDEDTALVGGPTEWVVMGRQRVSVFGPDGLAVAYDAGSTIELPAPT